MTSELKLFNSKVNEKDVFYHTIFMNKMFISLVMVFCFRSFYVSCILSESDLQVDNNVTRHLPTELLESDFDLLILHYLGLDHIGHMAGPHSPLIPPKLREMDQVIDTVYRALTEVSKVKNLAGSSLRYNPKIISIKLKITRLIPLHELKQIVENFVMRINKIIIWLESSLLQPGFSSLHIFRHIKKNRI